jgi:hypothetical protein
MMLHVPHSMMGQGSGRCLGVGVLSVLVLVAQLLNVKILID